jgi:glutathione S-transferase
MSDSSLTIVRFFKAARTRVFDAFVTAAGLQSWFGPEGYTVPRAEVDARPGGRYRIEMHSPEGGVSIVTGAYREVVRPSRLAFSWAWLEGDGTGVSTEVEINFIERDGGTEITLVQSGFPAFGDRDLHAGGWQSSFVCLDGALAGQPLATDARPTLLGDPRDPGVRSVRMAFIEKGVSYTLEPHAAHTPAVAAAHPAGRVPVLRNGSLAFGETTAILRYVDEAFPGPRLLPETPAARALAEQWLSIVSHDVQPVIAEKFVRQFQAGELDTAAVGALLPEIQRMLALIERGYAGKAFLAGERLTLPDLLLAPLIDLLVHTGEGPRLLVAYPQLRRTHQALAGRPSFTATRTQQ